MSVGCGGGGESDTPDPSLLLVLCKTLPPPQLAGVASALLAWG